MSLPALVLAGSASAAHAHHTAPATCPPGHSHLIAADAQAQLFVNAPTSNLSEPFEPEQIFGCAYGHRHVYRLGFPYQASAEGAVGIRQETLAGPIAAYESSSAEGDNGQGRIDWIVVVRDLRSGRVLHKVPTGTAVGTPNVPKPTAIGAGPTVAIIVKSDGAVAWLNHAAPWNGTYQVHELDKSGNRQVAEGPDIDPSSLALAGSTLYWTQGGKPFSASLN